MTVTVRLPATLADRIGGVAQIALPVAKLGECLTELARLHPPLQRIIWLDRSEVNPVILLFHNNRLLKPIDLQQPLDDGDQLDIVPSIEAG